MRCFEEIPVIDAAQVETQNPILHRKDLQKERTPSLDPGLVQDIYSKTVFVKVYELAVNPAQECSQAHLSFLSNENTVVPPRDLSTRYGLI